ncbi:MAG: ubiquinol-cytochrome C chaperone family protein [Actinomycetota bacterium]
MLFDRLRSRRRREAAAHSLYLAAVDAARRPAFYAGRGVPDTLDGRFDLLVVHAWLTIRRLNGLGEQGRDLSQALFDLMFADMDQNLREMGVSDLSVGKKVKQMAKAFYGRVAAYDQGLAEGDAALQAALARNLFGTAAPAADQLAAVTDWLRREAAHVDAQPAAELLEGRITFAAEP